MHKILLFFFFSFLLGALHARQIAWSNPLDVQFGDPYILRTSAGKYYMYGTGAGAHNGFVAYSSDDLVNWKREGQVYYGNNKNGWGEHSYWAPEAYERNGRYYLFYSAQWKENPNRELEHFKIGVAVADQPTGPFIDLQNKPIFNPDYPIIDANVLFAEDGRTYLYYSRCCYKHPVESEVATWARNKGWFKEIEESWVYGVEMKPDFSGVIGEPVLLLRPPVKMTDPQADWESRSVTSKEVNRRWTEGSYIFKKDDTYYMMYSANYFGGQNYAVGYATSKSPLGPFTKAANNPVLQKNTASGGIVTGTGHNSVTCAPDGKTMLCVYHGRTSKTGDERVVFIDKMTVKNGVLTVEGPTTGKQQLANTANPLLADPTIFFNNGKYYLYGTVARNTDSGFKAYSSVDKIAWKEEGYVLRKGESYGTKGFWAPQVFKHQGKFYMAYTANEHIAIASADGPLGPFTQQEKKPLDAPVKMIDPYLYIDPSGKIYLYHVRLHQGNRIFVAALDKTLSTIDTATVQECINASLPWEDTQHATWKVAEGPTIIRRKGWYYMIYSANDFRNPDYAIGYATARSAAGPWTKSNTYPIISRKNIGINGTGHGDVLTDRNGKILYVFHVHADDSTVSPRRTAMVELQFRKNKGKADELVALPQTFRLLSE
ncbi:glycoside hydrolase family 43 protein [Longitalea arenae]|uniref:glycoside hydrolase family 43 protein n=1 Tax=Longitalea arenae TaxID=2812558 RepID=UPI001966CEF8|nr:glycoside hydrolase family 43 protein [Longitalea arenae]